MRVIAPALHIITFILYNFKPINILLTIQTMGRQVTQYENKYTPSLLTYDKFDLDNTVGADIVNNLKIPCMDLYRNTACSEIVDIKDEIISGPIKTEGFKFHENIIISQIFKTTLYSPILMTFPLLFVKGIEPTSIINGEQMLTLLNKFKNYIKNDPAIKENALFIVHVRHCPHISQKVFTIRDSLTLLLKLASKKEAIFEIITANKTKYWFSSIINIFLSYQGHQNKNLTPTIAQNNNISNNIENILAGTNLTDLLPLNENKPSEIIVNNKSNENTLQLKIRIKQTDQINSITPELQNIITAINNTSHTLNKTQYNNLLTQLITYLTEQKNNLEK